MMPLEKKTKHLTNITFITNLSTEGMMSGFHTKESRS